eukprot:TRINITY_DN19732_c1_g1_i1.p1 TRINITY_DN19732_c1_g1~~TRINITY_DN19732_c1_g1_i1.p1  ORF type:complete len:698 (+),score=192.69 TRINITY_DN19732_c1_g1_i1:133-2226(+)
MQMKQLLGAWLLLCLFAQSVVGLRCDAIVEAACVADSKCLWEGGCYQWYPVVGNGECRDTLGNVPPMYVSMSEGYKTTGGEGQCETICTSIPSCLGVRVQSGVNLTRCVLYTEAALTSPPNDFTHENGIGTSTVQAWGNVGEVPADEGAWDCKAKFCDVNDCGCAAGQSTDCGVPSGYKGQCSCTSTATFTATLPTPTSTISDTVQVPPTPTTTKSLTLPITPTLTREITPTVPVYDECTGALCGVDQSCSDPTPRIDSLYDFVCTCLTSSVFAIGAPVPKCDDDECIKNPCHAGQTCADPNSTVASIGDYTCTCNNQPLLLRVGGPVPSCATAVLDECNPSPCFAGQTCNDPNTTLGSVQDYVCSCPNGGPSQVGGSPAICEYDECRFDRCGTGQSCTDGNTSVLSLNDFVCRCDASGVTQVGAVVPVCETRTATFTATVRTETATESVNVTETVVVPGVTSTETVPLYEMGDSVRVVNDAAKVMAEVEAAGLSWVPGMAKYTGESGMVTGIKNGVYQVQFSDGTKYSYPGTVLLDAAAPTPVSTPQGGSGGDDGIPVWVLVVVGLGVALLCICLLLAYITWMKKKEVASFSDGTAQSLPLPPSTPDPFKEELLSAPPAVLAMGTPSLLTTHTAAFDTVIKEPIIHSIDKSPPAPLTSPPLVLVSTQHPIWDRNPLGNPSEKPIFDSPSPFQRIVT